MIFQRGLPYFLGLLIGSNAERASTPGTTGLPSNSTLPATRVKGISNETFNQQFSSSDTDDSDDSDDSDNYTRWYSIEGENMTTSNFIRPYINNRPYPNVEEWKALGDSFSAGPGAGPNFDPKDPCKCMRRQHAYPPSLWRDPNFFIPSDPPEQTDFEFLSCTGAVAPDLVNPYACNRQVRMLDRFVDIVTLSIGGNDVQFTDILQICVYKLISDDDACSKQLEKSRELLYGPRFRRAHRAALDGIYENLEWRNRRTQYTAVYQTGYAQFFDAYTNLCNDKSFIPILHNGPNMTRELRSKLNNLVHQSNYVLQYYINWLNLDYYRDRPTGRTRYTPFVDFVDFDIVYNAHRFCREGVDEPERRNPDTWFFHFANGFFVQEPSNSSNSHALTSNASAEANGNNQTAQLPPWEWIVKTFHPKSAGHQASKDLLYLKTKFEVFARKLNLKRKDVWVIGDDQCYASQRPNSDFYGGFWHRLREILIDPHFYGWNNFNPPWHGGFATSWIGSQGPQGTQHDCYRGHQINEIHDEIRNSAIHDGYQSKLVILALGTMDVFLGYDLKNSHRRVGAILRTIFDHDPEATVLINHLPMFGYEDQGRDLHKKEGLQRVVEYNARLSGLANYWRTAHGKRVLKVSVPLTTRHKRDLFLPNRDGYNAIAWSIAEQMVIAESMGWLDDPPGPAVPGPPNPSPTPTNQARSPSITKVARDTQDRYVIPPRYQLPPDPGPTGDLICTQQRPEGAPSGDEILASLLQGMDKFEWVHHVACNTTEICKNSLFDTPPEAYWDWDRAPNGTMCLLSGGNDEEGFADATQLMIRRAAGDVDIHGTIGDSDWCGMAVSSVLSCITKSGFYGGHIYVNSSIELLVNITNLNFPNSPIEKPESFRAPIDMEWAERVVFEGEQPDPTLIYSSPNPMPTDEDDEWI